MAHQEPPGRLATDEADPGHPPLDEHSQGSLDKRALRGRLCLSLVWGHPIELLPDDVWSAASDTISDVLTAMFGPAGTWAADADGNSLGIDYLASREQEAVALLDHALASWQGDAEDYTRAPEDNPDE